jgi:hypothetical protein
MPKSTPDDDQKLQAEVSFALGAMGAMISVVNTTLPDHPDMQPLRDVAERAKDAYYQACAALGITEQNYVIINTKEGT